MAFTEDLTVFFDEAEHAVAATLKTSAGVMVRTLTVIVDTPLDELVSLSAGVEAGQPQVLCRTADIAAARHEYQLVIGATTYRIVNHKDDGTGVSTVWLR